jgi:hypothetical protein
MVGAWGKRGQEIKDGKGLSPISPSRTFLSNLTSSTRSYFLKVPPSPYSTTGWGPSLQHRPLGHKCCLSSQIPVLAGKCYLPQICSPMWCLGLTQSLEHRLVSKLVWCPCSYSCAVLCMHTCGCLDLTLVLSWMVCPGAIQQPIV